MKKNALKGIACILASGSDDDLSFGFFTVPVQAKKDTGVKAVKLPTSNPKRLPSVKERK